MSAKKLCAMLITKSLKKLTDDEENIVVDYLESIGIEVDIDTTSEKMCQILLEKTMKEELGRTIPMTAYANQLIEKESAVVKKKEKFSQIESIKKNRPEMEKKLITKSKALPGCVSSNTIFSKNLYDLLVNADLGIMKLEDGTSQYGALISVSSTIYNNIFENFSDPIIEITSSKGNKAYARISDPHDDGANLIYISPLVGYILNIESVGAGFVKLCKSVPNLSKANFTFYGTKDELNNILESLIEKIPSVVNAFSYLSLGMILVTQINGKEVKVRVDGLLDSENNPVFAGLIPFGLGDLPFEIEADM